MWRLLLLWAWNSLTLNFVICCSRRFFILPFIQNTQNNINRKYLCFTDLLYIAHSFLWKINAKCYFACFEYQNVSPSVNSPNQHHIIHHKTLSSFPFLTMYCLLIIRTSLSYVLSNCKIIKRIKYNLVKEQRNLKIFWKYDRYNSRICVCLDHFLKISKLNYINTLFHKF